MHNQREGEEGRGRVMSPPPLKPVSIDEMPEGRLSVGGGLVGARVGVRGKGEWSQGELRARGWGGKGSTPGHLKLPLGVSECKKGVHRHRLRRWDVRVELGDFG